MMSAGVLPARCSVTMLEFMKTVQRLPSMAGDFDENAASAMSLVCIPRLPAKFSKKEPQPDEHASLTTMSVTTPLSTQMAFMSWPPISKIKLTSGR